MTTARERAEELTKGWQGYTEYLAPTGLGTQNLVYRSITGFRDDIEAAILAAEQAAEARGRAAGIEMAAEFGWVIERDESEGSRLEYFTGAIHPALRWSNPGDHAAACRFARKQDAQHMLNAIDGARPHRVVQHGWHVITPPAERTDG
jgi:hypothetical protein